MKFGLWLLIAAAAVLWLNHAKRQRLKQRTPPAAKAAPGSTDARQSTEPTGEQIVACAHCGLHVPRSDAVVTTDGAALYCCEAHRRLHSPA